MSNPDTTPTCRETLRDPHPDPAYDAELARWHSLISKRADDLQIEARVMRKTRAELKSEYAAACFALRAVHNLRFRASDHQVVIL